MRRKCFRISGDNNRESFWIDSPRSLDVKLLADAVTSAPAGYRVGRDAGNACGLLKGEGFLRLVQHGSAPMMVRMRIAIDATRAE